MCVTARIWMIGSIVAALVFMMTVIIAVPTVAAAACPTCYGMQPIDAGIYVNAAMPDGKRREVQESIAAAEQPIREFFGTVSHRRVILVCGDEQCETRLESRIEGTARVRAFTYDLLGYPIVRISPRGMQPWIIGQELTHVEVHERIGFLHHMRGKVPAWFDEGLAVLIAGDRRYVRAGGTAAERCLPTPAAELPVRPLAWDELAGKAPWIYAKATCEVMTWMERHGGRSGVLAALAAVRAGNRFEP